ncbi:MAG: recombination mediator RecR [Deltaproteobacteria bacterium]|jgi:recombination protein RecR|nr:recombination mediator RecR [Deltaproteobacteria bacterium]
MRYFPAPLKELVKSLCNFPGVGEKSALRMALFILKMNEGLVEQISHSIVKAKREVRYCGRCGNFSEKDLCGICSREDRSSVICVVEEPPDIIPVEKSGEFDGRYHVLGGALSPIDGVMPENLKIEALLNRVKNEGVSEVIIATNLNVEGEATAFYLSSLLKTRGVKVTRIAYGMPIGADLEYADEFTVGKAIAFRREM